MHSKTTALTAAEAITDQRLRGRLMQMRPTWRHNGPKASDDDVAYARTLMADPCAYCGEYKHGYVDHVDHQTHGWENLTATCRGCNVGKGTHTLLRYLLAKRLRTERDAIQTQLRALGDAHGLRIRQLSDAA